MKTGRSKISAIRFVVCVLLLVTVSTALPAQTIRGVGVAHLDVPDPVTGGRLLGFVFYPATRGGGLTTIGPYQVAATFDAPWRQERLPLVVVSHGQGGSRLGHHDLATYLAERGLIVATLEHPGDNAQDTTGVGRPEVVFGRPRQVSALISALLDHPEWKGRIDARKIGVAGFSMGGYTSLLLVGAVPRWNRLADYCERRPDDRETCGLMERLASHSQSGSVRAFLETLQIEHGRWETTDARVGAAFAMAPLGVVFDRDGAARINRPVFLYVAENDQVLPPDENVRHLSRLIQSPVTVQAIARADHFVFLAPCSPALKRDVGAICADPPGVDRIKVHARINADALTFFRRTLNIVPDR